MLPKIKRICLATSKIQLNDYLPQPNSQSHFYWSNRDRSFEVLGIGAAHQITHRPDAISEARKVFPHIQTSLLNSKKNAPTPKCYGGFQFNKNLNYWLLPRYELINSPEGSFLIQNLKETEKAFETEKEFFSAITPEHIPQTEVPPKLEQRYDEPNSAMWNSFVQQVKKQIQDTDLKKVVLARLTRLHFTHQVDPVYLLKQISKITPSCYHYYFHFGQEHSFHGTFLGASPEQVFSRRGENINTEALAGTRPRGLTQEIDESLAKELLDSQKEKEEHLWVKKWIEQKLRPLSQDLKCVQENSVLALHRVQHLYSQYEGKLKSGIQDHEILEALHPTPALAGYPQEAAYQYIKQNEPFDRGWFTGSLGWISENSSEFVAGIRSALVQNTVVSLYAGAGIVSASQPDHEWEELNHKMSDYLKVLNVI